MYTLLKKFINWLKTNSFDIFLVLVIFAVTLLIAFKNYSQGTYLTGWDNLHLEFNFKLNIERSLNAVWQEYQGVGLLGGMSHAADLPRQIVLWGLSVFLPTSIIRYLWTFLMLLAGSLGTYFLIKDKSRLGGFTASIFYIFNLATVQYFFVPFETFMGFYGFLPWLLYFAIDYLKTGKNLWKYFLVSVFATCAFYVQTMFIVYGIFLIILSFKNIKRSIPLFLVTFLVNSFWLLPVLWFTFTSGQIPGNSEINHIASTETILMNQGRGGFENVVTFKGYWFDYYDFGTDQKFDYLFRPWIDYSSKPYLKEIGVGLFVVSIIGLIASRQIAWLLLLGIGYLMLSGFKIPISVLEEAFRNSFTKWSVAFSFVISIGLGFFVSKFKKFAIIPALIIIAVSIYSTLPILEGKLISERVRINIPNAYFETFDWFNNKSDGGRIGYFPAFDKWGWNYHDWGYGGSGFIWYGIKNPILDRAFNVWSPNNENYYNQVTKSILDGDAKEFKKTIDKYQVKYLFLDNSIVYPWGDKSLLKVDTVSSFAKDLGYKETYKNDFVTIYDTNIISTKFISQVTTHAAIANGVVYSKIDTIYEKYGNYIEDENGLSLPFSNFDIREHVKIMLNEKDLVFENSKTNSKVILQINEGKVSENFNITHGYQDAFNCDLKKMGSVQRTNLDNGRKYTATGGAVSCDYFVYENLKHNSAYVMHIKGENKEGRSLKLYLYNWENKRVELEELLPSGNFDSYYVLYPKNSSSSGYTLNIETRSFGKISSENVVDTIEFIPFDINFVQNLYIDSKLENISKTGNLEIVETQKYGTSLYKVVTKGVGLLELGQGYDEGWISYPKVEHVKVNSWANGFKINEDGTYYLFFWPQLLEWGGFLLLLLTFIYMIVKSKK